MRVLINKPCTTSELDPAKETPRRKQQPENMVRLTIPINIACGTCATCIFKGNTLSSRKEEVVGETCVGVQVSRFYFNCTYCKAELAIRTDPQHYSGYTIEYGAGRL